MKVHTFVKSSAQNKHRAQTLYDVQTHGKESWRWKEIRYHRVPLQLTSADVDPNNMAGKQGLHVLVLTLAMYRFLDIKWFISGCEILTVSHSRSVNIFQLCHTLTPTVTTLWRLYHILLRYFHNQTIQWPPFLTCQTAALLVWLPTPVCLSVHLSLCEQLLLETQHWWRPEAENYLYSHSHTHTHWVLSASEPMATGEGGNGGKLGVATFSSEGRHNDRGNQRSSPRQEREWHRGRERGREWTGTSVRGIT